VFRLQRSGADGNRVERDGVHPVVRRIKLDISALIQHRSNRHQAAAAIGASAAHPTDVRHRDRTVCREVPMVASFVARHWQTIMAAAASRATHAHTAKRYTQS